MSKTTIPAGGIADSAVTTAKINADAVDATKIADDAVSEEHLDNTALTGFSELSSLADADKFLVSDASDSNNIKYVLKSNLPSGVSDLIYEASITGETGGHDDYNDSSYFAHGTYDKFRVYIDDYEPASDGSNLLLQLKLGGVLRTNNYEYHTKLFQAGSDAAVNRSTGASSIRIIDDTGTASDELARGWFEYTAIECSSANYKPLIKYSFVTATSGGSVAGGWGAGLCEDSTGTLTAFRILPDSGALGNYKIRIYGMKS